MNRAIEFTKTNVKTLLTVCYRCNKICDDTYYIGTYVNGRLCKRYYCNECYHKLTANNK